MEDDDDVELEELANLCLMANIDITKQEIYLMENNNSNIDEVNDLESQFIFDELQDAFDDLYHEYKKSHKKYLTLK